MNDTYLEKQLKSLQYVKASDGLKDRIHSLTSELPSHQKAFFPLVAFQMGVALAVVLMLLLAGSGVVAAARYSRPGSFFYPVKQAIEALPVKVFKDTDTGLPTPTGIPTSTVTPIPTVQKKHLEQKTQEKEHTEEKEEKSSDEIHEVEGLSTQSPEVSISPVVKSNGNSNHENQRKFDFEQSVKQFFEHFHSSGNHKKED